MSNSISFVGRLGLDAELKQIGENTVLEFRVANNVGWGSRETTNWFRCSLWGRQAQNLAQYLLKGKQVYVSGELSLRPYTNREGIERLSADVKVNNIDLVRDGNRVGNQEGGEVRGSNERNEQGGEREYAQTSAPDKGSDEEDLPF